MGRTLFVTVAIVLAAGEARADEPNPHASCDAAFEAAELRLRPTETHLLDARESLRACALPTCQPWMVDDCTKRLVEVEGRIPSVVFSAENGRGAPLYDVRVREGDRELAAQIDGRAVEIDPGPHALVAERAGARAALTVVAIEGKKAQQVVFTFPDEVPAPAPPPTETAPVRPAETALAHPWARPVAVGLVAGAVVAAAIGVGFGLAAIEKKNDAQCNDSNVCQGSFQGALDAAHASTGAFIVGGALAASGVVTYLLFGRTRVSVSASAVRIVTTW